MLALRLILILKQVKFRVVDGFDGSIKENG